MAQGGGCVYRCFLAVAAVAVIALLVLVSIQYKHPTPPRYYASIVSVSGVGDHDRQGQRMQFALTLGVESQSPLWGWACLPRGTAVEVASHGVLLACRATGEEVCVVNPWDLWKVRKTTVMARRSLGVGGLPEFVVEGMVADMRRGVQVFDVTVRIPSTRQDGADGVGHDDGKLALSLQRRHYPETDIFSEGRRRWGHTAE